MGKKKNFLKGNSRWTDLYSVFFFIPFHFVKFSFFLQQMPRHLVSPVSGYGRNRGCRAYLKRKILRSCLMESHFSCLRIIHRLMK